MNYICFGGWLNITYAYVDTSSYLADSLFCKHEIPVKYGDEYIKEDVNYRIIFCKIKKKHKEKFEKALEELKNKMLICGENDYENFCNTFMKELEEGL